MSAAHGADRAVPVRPPPSNALSHPEQEPVVSDVFVSNGRFNHLKTGHQPVHCLRHESPNMPIDRVAMPACVALGHGLIEVLAIRHRDEHVGPHDACYLMKRRIHALLVQVLQDLRASDKVEQAGRKRQVHAVT